MEAPGMEYLLATKLPAFHNFDLFTLSYRHPFKFCGQCGFHGRADRMLDRHWPKVHSTIPVRNFSFVKLGQQPKTGVSTF